MSTKKRRILIVTDEPFLPARNGSSRVYLDTVNYYKERDWEVDCISFLRKAAQYDDPALVAAYGAAFGNHYILPGWSGGKTILGRVGYVLRELDRWVRGNIFPRNIFLKYDKARRDVREFLERNEFDLIYINKIHAAILLDDLLHIIRGKVLIDIHDDFIEKELQYRLAYAAAIRRDGFVRAFSRYRTGLLRLAFSRVNVVLSRLLESKTLCQCDVIRVSSASEYDFYRNNPVFKEKVFLELWSVDKVEPREQKKLPYFDFGFIGSDDVMNADGIASFFDHVVPKMKEIDGVVRMLIAGQVADVTGYSAPAWLQVYRCSHIAELAEFYDNVGFAIAPLRYGAGVSIKVLEARAWGVNIVCTPVASRGIPAEHGVLIAEGWDDFALTMDKLLYRYGQE